jgi:hypothetical protein
MDGKQQMGDEEVEEMKDPPLKKPKPRSITMKSTASLHAILSRKKPTKSVTLIKVEEMDELDE